jgi:hypothetical protein
MMMAFFQKETGTRITLVPYRGFPPEMQDLVEFFSDHGGHSRISTWHPPPACAKTQLMAMRSRNLKKDRMRAVLAGGRRCSRMPGGQKIAPSLVRVCTEGARRGSSQGQHLFGVLHRTTTQITEFGCASFRRGKQKAAERARRLRLRGRGGYREPPWVPGGLLWGLPKSAFLRVPRGRMPWARRGSRRSAFS